MSHTLFPISLPEREWTEFPAQGLSAPASGVIYRNGSNERGVPLGGLGTGFITLCTNSTLDYYSTIFNAFMERNVAPSLGDKPLDGLAVFTRDRSTVPSLKLPFLGLATGGRTWVLSSTEVDGTEGPSNIHYWGHYPVADVEYELDSPVGVGLRAWSPFLPGDGPGSNVPGAVFEIHLRNKTGGPQEGRIGFSFHGPRADEMAFNAHGPRQGLVGNAEYDHRKIDDGVSGVEVLTTWEDMRYSYALGAEGGDDVLTGGELTGEGWGRLGDALPETTPGDSGASIAVDFSLGAGERQTIRFFLGWYAPHWRTMVRRVGLSMNDYSHMYASKFSSARNVVRNLAQGHRSLLKRVLAWQDVIYGEQRLPGWLKDSLVNILAVLPQQSFWFKSFDPDHWWGSEGLFCVNESLLSCAQQACIANDEFGEWATNILFPEQALNKLRTFKHYQRPNGQTPSTLGDGTEGDQPWYDQQLPVDGQVYVHMVDRYWQATGDDAMLGEYYESVKAGMEFMKSIDLDSDGLLEVKGSNQYYDSWPAMAGPAIHISGYWLATLRIAERMAEKMGDREYAEDCRSWIKRGSRSLEEKLWNPEQDSYLLYHQPETGIKSDSILSDQLIGQWFAHIHGLPRIFPEDRTQRVLETIWSHNVKAAQFGVRTAVTPDLGEDKGGLYSGMQAPSYSTLVPSMLMVYAGDAYRGIDVAHSTWQRMVVDGQMAWDMAAHVTQEGKTGAGLEYYHNTMLWAMPMAVLDEDLSSYRSATGLVGRIVKAASR
jgi:uncharacterized protein (DUF608 family)